MFPLQCLCWLKPGLVQALREPAREFTSSLKPYQESESDRPGLLSSGDSLLGAFQQAAISGCPLTAVKIKAPAQGSSLLLPLRSACCGTDRCSVSSRGSRGSARSLQLPAGHRKGRGRGEVLRWVQLAARRLLQAEIRACGCASPPDGSGGERQRALDRVRLAGAGLASLPLGCSLGGFPQMKCWEKSLAAGLTGIAQPSG